MKSFSQYITELFEKPYKWTARDKQSRDTMPIIGHDEARYYFKTDNGKTMVVRFANRVRNSKYITSIDFFDDDNSNDRFGMSGEGDAMKIMSTVLDIIKDGVKKVDFDEIRFFADKKDFTDKYSHITDRPVKVKTGRAKLYRTMVKRFAGKLGYKSKEKDGGKVIMFTLEKK